MTQEKDFNKGVVWGKVREVKFRKTRENGKPYADLKLVCPTQVYGDILAHGRLWGEARVEDLKAMHRKAPDTLWKFTGQLSQFERRGVMLTGYNLFKFEPAEQGALPRAVFILAGEVAEKRFGPHPDEPEGDDTILVMSVKGETFEIWAREHLADRVEVLRRAQVKGALRDADAFFGGSGDVRPWAEETRRVE